MRQQQQLSQQDWQLLSAYLDGQLSAGDLAKLDRRLEDQTELRTALDELKVTRAMLRSAAKQRVPRNFTLTPAMVEKARPRPLLRLVPILNFASAAAALAMVIFLVVGLLPGANLSAAPAPAAAPAQEAAQTMTVEDTTGQPAPLIWSAPGGMGGGDGLGGDAADSNAAPAPEALTAKGMGGGGNAGPGFSLPPQVVESMPAANEAPQSQQQKVAPTEAPAGALMIPAMTATPAPQATLAPAAPALPAAPAAVQPEQTVADPQTPLIGSGPILGVRPLDEARAENQQVIDQYQAAQAQPENLGSRWIAPLTLALIAAGAALASWLIRRKTSL